MDGWKEGEGRGEMHSFFFVMIWEVTCHFMEIKLRKTQLRAVWESAVRPDRPHQGLRNERRLKKL